MKKLNELTDNYARADDVELPSIKDSPTTPRRRDLIYDQDKHVPFHFTMGMAQKFPNLLQATSAEEQIDTLQAIADEAATPERYLELIAKLQHKLINRERVNENTMENNMMESLAYLIENVLEKSEVVMNAQAIVDKLQDMAEDLSTVEAKMIMPLLDSLTTAFGPQLAQQFSSVATEQIRNLITAVQGAKSGLDQEIMRMKQGIEGGDTSDLGMMGNEQPPEEPMADDGSMDGEPGPEPKLSEVPPDMSGNMEDDEVGAENNFAGRARKESVLRKGRVIESADDHYKGLSNWVNDYKSMRKNGNIKGAKEIREKIKAAIAKHGLDADKVWGKDPDKKVIESAVAEDFLGGVDRTPTTTAPADHKSPHFDGNLDNIKGFHGGAGKLAHEVAGMIRSEPLTGQERKALSNVLSHFCAFSHDPSHWGIDTETKLTSALKANDIYDHSKPAVAKIVDKLRTLVGTISHAHRSMTESAIRNLKKSANPDEMIFNTFRKKLSETRDAQLAAIRTARTFAIDLDDVVSIVREAAEEAKKCPKCKGTGKIGKGPSHFKRDCPECKGTGKVKKTIKEAKKEQNEEGRGKFKVNHTSHDKKTRSNDRFETKAEASKFAADLRKKGYHDVELTESSLNEFKLNTPDSAKGMFKGKSTEDLEKEMASVKKRIAAAEKAGRDHANLTKELRRVEFAIRAHKSKGGKGWHKKVNEEELLQNVPMYPIGAKSATDVGNRLPGATDQTSLIQKPNQSSSTVKPQTPSEMFQQPDRAQTGQSKPRGDTVAALEPKPSVRGKPQPMVDDGRHGTMITPLEKDDGSDVPQNQRQAPYPTRKVPRFNTPVEMPGRIAR